MFDRAIVIIRNPLDAAISEFNRHQFTTKHQGNNISLANAYLPLQTFLDENFAKYFTQFMDYWMAFHNKVLKYCTKNNCHIVAYEDLKSNLINEMKGRCQSPKYENGFKHLWHLVSGNV